MTTPDGSAAAVVLATFDRVRRPFAWCCLIGGALAVPLTVAGILFTDEPVAGVLGSLFLFLDGWDKVTEVEQEAGTVGTVDPS